MAQADEDPIPDHHHLPADGGPADTPDTARARDTACHHAGGAADGSFLPLSTTRSGNAGSGPTRRYMPDEELAAIIEDRDVELMVLYVKGVPAGFAELDFRGLPDEADLAYFGLMPEFIGRKLGGWFLHWAVSELWSRGPESITVNTCTKDHPSALPMYQRIGFVPYSREESTLRPLPGCVRVTDQSLRDFITRLERRAIWCASASRSRRCSR